MLLFNGIMFENSCNICHFLLSFLLLRFIGFPQSSALFYFDYGVLCFIKHRVLLFGISPSVL